MSTHLPADHFIKPLLVALGIPQGLVGSGICGKVAPTSGKHEQVCGPANRGDLFEHLPRRTHGAVWMYFEGEVVAGYFARETALEQAVRRQRLYRLEHPHASPPEILPATPGEWEHFRSWVLRTPEALAGAWFLRFRDDGRTLPDHMAAITCEACLVALDAFQRAYQLTIEIARPAPWSMGAGEDVDEDPSGVDRLNEDGDPW